MNDLKCMEIDELAEMFEDFPTREKYENLPPMTKRMAMEYLSKNLPTELEINWVSMMLMKVDILLEKGYESEVHHIVLSIREKSYTFYLRWIVTAKAICDSKVKEHISTEKSILGGKVDE